MDDLPPIVLAIAGLLTVAIHVALASGVAFQSAELLKRLPKESRKISPKLCYLLLIPVFSLIWIWVVMLRVTSSFASSTGGDSTLTKWPYIISSSFCVCFIFLDPNWAWLIVLLMFIPYRKRIMETLVESSADTDNANAEQD